MTAPPRLAVHQGTTERQWGFAESVEGYARHGVPALTVRRSLVEDFGSAGAVRRIGDAGLRVLGVSRSAPLTGDDPGRIAANHDENRRAIGLAAALSATHLVMISGGLPEGARDLAGARARAHDALAALLPEARAAGVILALEAIHPMRAATGCVWNTLGAANALCAALGAGTGLIVDAYHVWWDPGLDAALADARGRIVSFQFSDWLRETASADGADRGMPGDGVIDLRALAGKVRATGYDGFDELEMFSERTWWQRDPDLVIRTAIARYREHVLGEEA